MSWITQHQWRSRGELKKLGRPQLVQTHMHEQLPSDSYIWMFMAKQGVWYQTSHISHWIRFWLHFTALEHPHMDICIMGWVLISICPLRKSSDSKNNPKFFFLESFLNMADCLIIASKPALIGWRLANVSFSPSWYTYDVSCAHLVNIQENKLRIRTNKSQKY